MVGVLLYHASLCRLRGALAGRMSSCGAWSPVDLHKQYIYGWNFITRAAVHWETDRNLQIHSVFIGIAPFGFEESKSPYVLVIIFASRDFDLGESFRNPSLGIILVRVCRA